MSASASHSGKELYEFGPFRIDAQREILFRAGESVSLTPKTFQILLVLVRHAQEVVAKDELMKAVWPDTFVEEANLSRNIFMLRKALGESPQDHRYIVTVPGRGYRLAESVRLIPEHDVSIVAASHSKVELQVKETWSWHWIPVVVVCLVASAAVVLTFSLRHSPALTEKDTLVLADFTNSTGEQVFDGTLRQGLAVQLEQSPFLSLLSEGRIQHTLRLMGRPADARLTPELAREICERTGSTAVLQGSIASLGSRYVLGLHTKNCSTGDVLDDEQVQAVRKEDVLNALTDIATRFRSRVGESLATVQKLDRPLAEATTPSLEALKAYSLGLRALFVKGADSALPFFQRATKIDPKFAMAHAYVARVYDSIEEPSLSAESTSRAYQLRDRTSEPEGFYIAVSYDTQVTGNLEKARQNCDLWAQTYPRDIGVRGFLAGTIDPMIGKYEESVEEAKKAIDLDPDFAIGYALLAFGYENLDRLAEAEITLERAAQRKLEIPNLLIRRYDLAFLKGDKAGMAREGALGQRTLGAEDWIANREAFVLAYSGHLQQARIVSRRAIDLARQAAHQERAASFEARAALREAFFGNTAAARRNATAALDLSTVQPVADKDNLKHGPSTLYGAALALALSGDFPRAQLVANEMDRHFPEDTLVRFSYLPVLRAVFALKQGEPGAAIELLQVATPYELGASRTNLQGSFVPLYAVYVRGEAYMAAHEGTQAAAEFQKILDHPGIVISDPVGALAQLQLGRAFALSGDKAKAKTAYQDFLTLWKDADPEIPILKRAKMEYSKLQ